MAFLVQFTNQDKQRLDEIWNAYQEAKARSPIIQPPLPPVEPEPTEPHNVEDGNY